MCEFCSDTKERNHLLFDSSIEKDGIKTMSCLLKENKIVNMFTLQSAFGLEGRSYKININFCPICGRYLKEDLGTITQEDIQEIFKTFKKEELAEIISALYYKLRENGIKIGSIESPDRLKIQYITSDGETHETTRDDNTSWHDRIVLDFSNFRKAE